MLKLADVHTRFAASFPVRFRNRTQQAASLRMLDSEKWAVIAFGPLR